MKKPALLLLFILFVSGLNAQPAFDLNHTTRNYDQIHIKLSVSFDFEKKQVTGISEYTFTPLTDAFNTLILHSKTTIIKKITLKGTKLNHNSTGGLLTIMLDKMYKKSDTLTLQIEYSTLPERGIYFFSPSDEAPAMPYQIWTQGQSDYNRYWYPAYDLPDDKLTSELLITVPSKFKVSANGILQNKSEDKNGKTTWYWKMDQPYSNYLTTVIVGEYDILTEMVENTNLEHYFPLDWDKSDYAYIYGRTANMLQYFNRTLMPYPYSRYAQIPVQDFEWGGMENVTATTLNRRIQHDNCVKPNYSADGLIAHELAHQWFGDLLTCRDWDHTWLNEGFATYYTTLWELSYSGYDAYISSHIATQRDYTGQWLTNINNATDSTKAARIPVDLTGGLAYDKGASILNMIRYELGVNRYKKAVQEYVNKYKNGSVVSDNFRDALPKVERMDWVKFFDQWVYGSGYPELQIQYNYDQSSNKIKVKIEQTPSFGSSEPYFVFNLPVEILSSKGAQSAVIPVNGPLTNFEIPFKLKPYAVTFNSNSAQLCTYEVAYTFDELIYILNYSDDASSRIYAASQLHKFDNKGTDPLAYALKNEKNFLVKKEIILSLDKINTIYSLRALYSGMDDLDGRVRESAARTIAAFVLTIKTNNEQTTVQDLLLKKLKSECNHYVIGEILESYGKLNFADSYSVIKEYALRTSHLDAIRSGAFKGLAKYENDELFDIALKALDYNISTGDMHLGDITVLEWAAKHYTNKPAEVTKIIAVGIKNPYFRTRNKAALLAGELGITSLKELIINTLANERRTVVKEPLEAALKTLENIK